ncbi:MAG TPA: hypothetical protein VIH93_10520, partial [Thermoanaerobaculia bacterium]
PAIPPIRLVWHSTPEERARMARAARDADLRRQNDERRRIAALRPQLEAWSRRYEPAARPLRAALSEAIGYLARGRGPESRTVCYPVADALPGLAALQRAPDPLLDHRLAAALATLRTGTEACTRGLPATGLRWLREGERRLGEADTFLASYRSYALPVEHGQPLRPAPSPPSGIDLAPVLRSGELGDS